MRTISDAAAVRLYHLDPDSGGATTLLYATLGEALRIAQQQQEAIQDNLFLQTSNDVVAYRDLIEG